MKSERVVPIRFVDRNGNPTSPHEAAQSECIPVIDVLIRSPFEAHLEVRCQALVDTGADYCVASEQLLRRVGAPVVRAVNHLGATGSQKTNLHDALLILTDSSGFHISVSADIACQSDVHSHTAYPLILGRGLLRHGRLTLDYPATVFNWTCMI